MDGDEHGIYAFSAGFEQGTLLNKSKARNGTIILHRQPSQNHLSVGHVCGTAQP